MTLRRWGSARAASCPAWHSYQQKMCWSVGLGKGGEAMSVVKYTLLEGTKNTHLKSAVS